MIKTAKELMTMDWEEYELWLQSEYPKLYPEDKDGKPEAPVCGFSLPVGWRPLVANLHKALHDYKTRNYRMVPDPEKKWKIRRWNCTEKLLNMVINLFNPYKKFYPKPKPLFWAIPKDVIEKVEASFSYKLQKRLIGWKHKKRPAVLYVKRYPCQGLCIEQVKEKFGGLRFYVRGADEHVEGMISFAETLSEKTCMETGEEGVPCVKRGWWAVLAKHKAEELGYTLNNSNS